MRRDSCRSVPRMCSPPAARTFSFSMAHCSRHWATVFSQSSGVYSAPLSIWRANPSGPEGLARQMLKGAEYTPEDWEKTVAQCREQCAMEKEKVLAAGGLHILGTERHESRRIDNQLRGRSGRQGDPGSSRFYLSLEDNLMRIFAGDRVKSIMQRFGVKGDEAIEHPWVTKAIESAQRKVEAHNFDIRKELLEYDDVANDQRKVIYEQRNELLSAADISATIKSIFSDVINAVISEHIPPQSVEEQWKVAELQEHLERDFAQKLDIQGWLASDETLHEETLRQKIVDAFLASYKEKEQQTGAEVMRQFEKAVLLQVLDNLWREHLAKDRKSVV